MMTFLPMMAAYWAAVRATYAEVSVYVAAAARGQGVGRALLERRSAVVVGTPNATAAP